MQVLSFTWKVTKPYRKYLFLVSILMILVAGYSNFISYILKLIVDANDTNKDSLVKLFFIYGFLIFSLDLVWTLINYLNIKTNPMRTDIAHRISSQIENYEYIFFQHNLSGSIASRIKDVARLIPELLNVTIHDYLQTLFKMIIAIILLAETNHIFATLLLLFIILFFSIFFKYIKKANMLSAITATSDARIWGGIVDYISNILIVKYFVSNQHENSILNKLYKNYNINLYNKDIFLLKLYLFLGIIYSIYMGIVLYLLITFYSDGLVTKGDLVFVTVTNYKMSHYLFFLTYSLRSFVTNWGTLEEALIILEKNTALEDKPNAKDLTLSSGKIHFDNVKFHYKGTLPLFNNTSVTIYPGQKVGLVGYSGSGKSTFVNLILRLYAVNEGHIYIDDQDINLVTQSSLRNAIGIIPQDNSLFHRTLMENIRYGRIDASDEEVIEAAKKANAHDFITKLPDGYDSTVGEGGIKLSGGQRQRIAIARAILKNAPILILDEATSQLDSLTEMQIQNALWEFMENKTTIVIAHRLSTLLHMDRILVFDNGEIVEDGTHQDLLDKGGFYKTLWDAQVEGFLPYQRKED